MVLEFHVDARNSVLVNEKQNTDDTVKHKEHKLVVNRWLQKRYSERKLSSVSIFVEFRRR